MPDPAAPVVVVADDDRGVNALFVTALERAGFIVHAATDGLRALELIRAHEVDVLLLDLTMPPAPSSSPRASRTSRSVTP